MSPSLYRLSYPAAKDGRTIQGGRAVVNAILRGSEKMGGNEGSGGVEVGGKAVGGEGKEDGFFAGGGPGKEGDAGLGKG